MSDTPTHSIPAGPVQAHVTLQRQNIFSDLGRLSLKIIVASMLIAVFGAIAAGAIAASLAAGFGAAAGIDVAEEDTEFLSGAEESETAILVVNIEGVILSHPPRQSDGFFGVSDVAYGYEIKQTLLDAAENEAVTAVMLHVTTPGGSISGSNAIHEGVLALKEVEKLVVTYVDGVSASGGVWATAATDAIFADHGSVVGSVGVLGPALIEYVEPMALGGLFYGVETAGGVKLHVSSAGTGKDLGNPFRAPTEQEKARLEAIVDEYYEDFLVHMADQRGMDRARLESEFGASVFANRAAEAAGFITGTKTYEETAAWIGEQLEVGEDFRLIAPKTEDRGFLGFMVESRQPAESAEDAAARERAVICGELQGQVVAMAQAHRAALCGW